MLINCNKCGIETNEFKEQSTKRQLKLYCNDCWNRINRRKQGFIYFIKSETKVKIGFTINVNRRYKAIQSMSPEKLELLGFITGDVRLERRLHKLFIDYRSHGEWFEYNKCKGYIERLLKI